MKLLNTILLILLTASLNIFAQQQGANISFDKEVHDFGTLKENGGISDYRFEFTNTGNQPLILTNVKPSCGCTSGEWSREPIVPGARGFIEVKFNPKGRPGPFNKSIAVSSNAIKPTTILHIKGNVEQGEKTIEEQYRYKMGDIRLERRNIYIPQIGPDETKTGTVNVVNVSSTAVTPEFRGVPSHIRIETIPESLQPNEKGMIKVTYDASKINDWGSVNNWLVFSTDGKMYNNRLAVTANIEEDFSKLNAEELAKAPAAEFKETNFNFGNIKQGDKVEHTFTVTNYGKSDLIIRKVQASCGCTAVNPSKNVIKPGEKTDIKVIFDSKGRKGRQNKAVTVITNDPKNVKKVLWVRGEIEA